MGPVKRFLRAFTFVSWPRSRRYDGVQVAQSTHPLTDGMRGFLLHPLVQPFRLSHLASCMATASPPRTASRRGARRPAGRGRGRRGRAAAARRAGGVADPRRTRTWRRTSPRWSTPSRRSSPATGCPTRTGGRSSGRSPSTPTPRSSACSRRATGSVGRRRCKRKAILLAKVQDEAGHGLYLYSAAETLGISRDELVERCSTAARSTRSIFNYPTLTWADVGAIGWLVDGAAIINQVPLCRCSYGPYARAMVRICKEESFHQRQGYEILHTLAHGTPAQQAMAQDAVDRWWWPVADDVRAAGRRLHPLRAVDGLEDQALLQRRAAPALRRHVRPAGRDPRAALPDAGPALERGAAGVRLHPAGLGRADAGDPGDGPCNRERMAHRRAAHEDGAWVREAAAAYAAKRAAAAGRR